MSTTAPEAVSSSSLPPAAPSDPKIGKIVDDISGLTLLQAADLVTLLKVHALDDLDPLTGSDLSSSSRGWTYKRLPCQQHWRHQLQPRQHQRERQRTLWVFFCIYPYNLGLMDCDRKSLRKRRYLMSHSSHSTRLPNPRSFGRSKLLFLILHLLTLVRGFISNGRHDGWPYSIGEEICGVPAESLEREPIEGGRW